MDIYKGYETYQKGLITLRQTKMEDAKELLKCYSDEKAVPILIQITVMVMIFTIRQ